LNKNAKIEAILAVLPQTQCGACGFPGCRPYAEAIAGNQAAINLCPPGGHATLEQLGQLTNQATQPLQSELAAKLQPPQVALIDEAACIGCTKCIQACPVDAIYGAAKQMHVVLTESCTGCTLCVDPCPVDCISMVPVTALVYDKKAARTAYEAKLARGGLKRAGILALTAQQEDAVHPPKHPPIDRKRFIAEAIARVKAKKS
jgi:Na+-translocating ferredoxin:NAD+ oxidoreductase subunit B